MTADLRQVGTQSSRLEPVEAPRSLRDEFAMAGLAVFSENLRAAADRNGAIRNAAVSAYALADAMMKARGGKT